MAVGLTARGSRWCWRLSHAFVVAVLCVLCTRSSRANHNRVVHLRSGDTLVYRAARDAAPRGSPPSRCGPCTRPSNREPMRHCSHSACPDTCARCPARSRTSQSPAWGGLLAGRRQYVLALGAGHTRQQEQQLAELLHADGGFLSGYIPDDAFLAVASQQAADAIEQLGLATVVRDALCPGGGLARRRDPTFSCDGHRDTSPA